MRDADAFVQFATGAFGATRVREARTEAGRLQHARLRIGSALIMLNEANDDYAAQVSQMHLRGADVADATEKAVAHGASVLMPPNLRSHGEHMAGVTDPCGNIWWLAAPA